MKSIFKILSLVALTFLSVSLFSQPLQPTGFPTSNSPNSWSILRGGVDSFHCFIAHDTFPARYNTIVSTPSGDFYYSKVWVSGQKNWFKINDTTGIHNAIVGLQGQITALNDSLLNKVNVKDSGSTYVTPYRANITYQPIGSYVTTNTSQTITGQKSFNQGTLFVGSIYGGGNGHLLVSESGGYSSAIFQNKGYVLADSADVTNGLNLKVAYSDTPAMLSPYLPKWLASGTYLPFVDTVYNGYYPVLTQNKAASLYQTLLTNPITGTGAAGQVAVWTGANTETGYSGFTFNSSTGALTLSQASGTGKWNLYSSGTASSYHAGNLLLGGTTDDGTDILQVNGTAYFGSNATTTISGAANYNYSLQGRYTIGSYSNTANIWETFGSNTRYNPTANEAVNNTTALFGTIAKIGTYNAYQITGLGISAFNYGSGTLSAAYGAFISTGNLSTGLVTNSYGIFINSVSASSSNQINNSYGIYINSQSTTGVGTGYGLYQSSITDLNVFKGNLLLGTNVNNAAGIIQSAGNIVPATTATYTLGTSAYQWSNVYTNQLTQQSTIALESAPLGSELLSTSGWTTTGWVGTDPSVGFTHTTGNTTALTNSITPTVNNLYQVTFTVTSRTAGSFTITLGGVTSNAYSATNAWGPKATTTGTLSITPTTDFNGTIVISIKLITGTYSPSYVLQNSVGNSALEIRSTTNGLNNQFIGINAGRYNTTGYNNTANGLSALYSNTTGYYNTANGLNALQNNTTGYSNTANGLNALYSNTTGYNNTANGGNALYSSGKTVTAGLFITGVSYTIISTGTTDFTLIGAANSNPGTVFTATGAGSGTGTAASNSNNNTADGYGAGRYLSDGSTPLTAPNNSLFVGYNTMASADGNTNENVIGYNAIGNGSNSFTLGNSSITKTILKGNLLLGTTIDDGVNKLQINGSMYAFIIKANSATTPVTGSTSGTAVFTQPNQGTGLKIVMITLTSLLGTASYTFPTAFINTPVVLSTSGLATSIVTTNTTTSCTVTGTTSSGTLILMGL